MLVHTVAVGRAVRGGSLKKQFATRVSKIRRSLSPFLATKKHAKVGALHGYDFNKATTKRSCKKSP